MILRCLGGVAVGLLLVVISHRLSHAVSKVAVAHGVVELNGEWFLPRFIAWAVPSAFAAVVLWLIFRNRAFAPAVIAALTVPILYVATFLMFFGLPDGLALVGPYTFESAVVILVIPGTVYFLRKRDA